MVKKMVISQLQSVGEGALSKVAQSSATKTALQGALQLKDKGEKIFHVLESVEHRLSAIENRLDKLEQTKKPAPRRAAAKTTTAAKPAARKKTA